MKARGYLTEGTVKIIQRTQHWLQGQISSLCSFWEMILAYSANSDINADILRFLFGQVCVQIHV